MTDGEKAIYRSSAKKFVIFYANNHPHRFSGVDKELDTISAQLESMTILGLPMESDLNKTTPFSDIKSYLTKCGKAVQRISSKQVANTLIKEIPHMVSAGVQAE